MVIFFFAWSNKNEKLSLRSSCIVFMQKWFGNFSTLLFENEKLKKLLSCTVHKFLIWFITKIYNECEWNWWDCKLNLVFPEKVYDDFKNVFFCTTIAESISWNAKTFFYR
jgi:hypothetical protein